MMCLALIPTEFTPHWIGYIAIGRHTAGGSRINVSLSVYRSSIYLLVNRRFPDMKVQDPPSFSAKWQEVDGSAQAVFLGVFFYSAEPRLFEMLPASYTTYRVAANGLRQRITVKLNCCKIKVTAMQIVLLFPAMVMIACRYFTRCRDPLACGRCGYDLRATRDRCPECGLVIAEGNAGQ